MRRNAARIGRQRVLTGVLGRIEISSVQGGIGFGRAWSDVDRHASHRQVDAFRAFVQRNDFGALLIALVMRARLRPVDQTIDGCRQSLSVVARSNRCAVECQVDRARVRYRRNALPYRTERRVECRNPRSRCSDVLVNDTSETIPAHNTSVTGYRRCRTRPRRLRWREGQRALWPVPVVMIDEHFKGPLEVLLVQNQQLVETFRADGAHESLGDTVGLGRAKRRTNNLNPLASEHLVKPVGEFLIAIANQKPHRFRALGHGSGQLPRLLNDPWRVGIRRATGHLHAAAAQLDEKEDVEPLQPDRLDREEIHGQQTLVVGADEFAPRRLAALTCRSETGGPEPRAYGGR